MVGFLGDGINDAPPLRAADVGISVNNAVDVAKDTADLVLMKKSLLDKDWNSLYIAIHKMIPSFSIIGINPDFEKMAKRVQEFASTHQQQSEGIYESVMQIELVCKQACIELEEEFNRIKNANK